MSLELSLYQLESQLSELIEMREQTCESLKLAESEGDLPQTIERLNDDVATIDNAIREYIGAEIRKVDGIRAFWRHCELMAHAAKEEADVQTARSRAWKNRLDRLKDTVKLVMETIPFPDGKPKKLEGRTGALYLKANGGKQAVEIHDESLVPDELCTVTVTMTRAHWRNCVSQATWLRMKDNPKISVGQRVPSLSLIAERLAQKCARCDETGEETDLTDSGSGRMQDCGECGGSGRQSVPGARFAERGNHVECR